MVSCSAASVQQHLPPPQPSILSAHPPPPPPPPFIFLHTRPSYVCAVSMVTRGIKMALVAPACCCAGFTEAERRRPSSSVLPTAEQLPADRFIVF